jgi:hypothetical protein
MAGGWEEVVATGGRIRTRAGTGVELNKRGEAVEPAENIGWADGAAEGEKLACGATAEQTFLTKCIVYFLNTVHCYNILEEYCYYEIQIHKALCEFPVKKGYCWLKEGLPP